jgi:hypothetical protein
MVASSHGGVGEELTVLEDDVAVGIDDDGGVVWVLVRVGVALHDGEHAVYAALLARLRESLGLWAGDVTQELVGQPLGGVEALGAVFREHDELHARIARLRGVYGAHDALYLPVDVLAAVDHWCRKLNSRHKETHFRF